MTSKKRKKKPAVKRVTLKQLFGDLQRELEQTLLTAKNNIPHAGSKGDATEADWIAMLDKHLPKRYCVTKAFVIDHTGRLSQQLDLVIYDKQYGPVVFHRKGVTYIPAESVYAVFEVKPTINAEYVTYAIEKAASVRRLKRTSVAITSAMGSAPHDAKPPKPIITGILAYDMDWKKGFGKPFAKLLQDAEVDGRIDLGCSLVGGAFNVDYAGAKPDITTSDTEEALVSFFMTLLHRLQPLGTVTAIDLTAYGDFTLGKKHGT